MDIKEILSLDRTIANAKKIDQFLSKTDKYTTEYLKAFCYKMVIWGDNNRINDALKEVYSYVPFFSEMVDDDVIIICEAIMHITLKANRLDEYQKYLQIKIGRLPTSRLKEKYLDYFYYYLALKDYNQARISALEYAKFNNTKEENIKIELELLRISELLRDEETFNIARERLENLFKDSFDFGAISDFHLRVLKMLFILKNYSEAKSFALDFLDDPHISKDNEIEAASIYLKILILEHEYKKGMIFESKYADDLDKASPQISLNFAKTALNLYDALGHKISIEYYNDLINEYESELKKDKKEAKKKKEELIIIPDILVEKPIAKNKAEEQGLNLIKVVEDQTQELKINSYFNDLIEGTNALLDFNRPLRDNIRESIIKMGTSLKIEELDLLYFNAGYHLHKYKNQRVYDKHYDSLLDSLQKSLMKTTDIAYFTEEKLAGYLDLFYQKPIEYPYAISFPLFDDKKNIGVLTIYSKTNILDDENLFTSLCLLKSEFNLLLLKEISSANLLTKSKYENYIFSVTDWGYKIIEGDKLKLSALASALLGLDLDTNLNDFYLGLAEVDKNRYLNLLLDLKKEPKNNVSLTYSYTKNGRVRYFKETFFTYFNEELTILALFEDVTKACAEANRLKQKLYQDKTTGFSNKNKLLKDILAYEDKFSLVLISLYNLEGYRDIYGYDFIDSFNKSLAKSLDTYFQNKYYVEPYFLKEGFFALMIKNNLDKRLLQSRIKELLAYLEVSLVDLGYNIEPHYNAGILRLDGKLKQDIGQTLDHLYDAYLLAKEEYSGLSNYCFFSLDSYKKHFKDRVIESNIALALDTNQIEIKYQQIVDIKNQEVYGYYAHLNIPNGAYTKEDIKRVIQKKNLYNRLDKYKLMHVASDLRRIYNDMKGYFEIFLEIANDTANDNIKNFIKAQLNFFKIPANMINIIVDSYTPDLDELKKMHIGVITKNIYDIINHKANAILLDFQKINPIELKKLIAFLESYKAIVILGEVNEANLEELKKENVQYLYGDIYKKSYSMVDLIAKLK